MTNMEKYIMFVNQALDDVKDKLNFRSDAALAEWLGVSRMAVSHYRVGKRLMNDWLLIRLCKHIGRPMPDVLKVIFKYKPIKQELKEGVQAIIDMVGSKK